MTYNDTSVLENHHVAAALKVAAEHGVFENMKRSDFLALKKRIISNVLATDIAKH